MQERRCGSSMCRVGIKYQGRYLYLDVIFTRQTCTQDLWVSVPPLQVGT